MMFSTCMVFKPCALANFKKSFFIYRTFNWFPVQLYEKWFRCARV